MYLIRSYKKSYENRIVADTVCVSDSSEKKSGTNQLQSVFQIIERAITCFVVLQILHKI